MTLRELKALLDEIPESRLDWEVTVREAHWTGTDKDRKLHKFTGTRKALYVVEQDAKTCEVRLFKQLEALDWDVDSEDGDDLADEGES